MRIQALKTTVDGNVMTRKGEIVEMDEWKARDLINMGYAVHIPEPEESIAAPIAFNNPVFPDPFPKLQVGGRDGLEKPASLSQEDQVRPKRTYKRRVASAE